MAATLSAYWLFAYHPLRLRSYAVFFHALLVQMAGVFMILLRHA